MQKRILRHVKEWGLATLIAILGYLLITTLIFQSLKVSSISMEKTLLEGDLIYVSKIHYGPRLPNTPLSFPFAHQKLPFFNIKAYWDGLQLPYLRFPGISQIQCEDSAEIFYV